MRKFMNIIIAASLICNAGYAVGEVITPDKDETITTRCECLQAITDCQLKIVSSAVGNPTHSWSQTNYLKKGVETDLNAACYQQRDADGMGGGFCCTHNSKAESISKLFRGTRQ